jgi:hypothetical protein
MRVASEGDDKAGMVVWSVRSDRVRSSSSSSKGGKEEREEGSFGSGCSQGIHITSNKA